MFDTIESMYETSKDEGGSATSQSAPSKMDVGAGRVVDVVVVARAVVEVVVSKVEGGDIWLASLEDEHDTIAVSKRTAPNLRSTFAIKISD
ncbi:MAG: hypothetical protein O3B66_01825 [Actinomycetota bacterium]|jgi:hypothetical protein|nr:hypothetical protein [Actinomycetota bacterium]MDA3011200.1 hypothetical protein [Actinomycetota bacterium]MDA3024380.1 hypothetical protein [Actinomycetota bacterium]